MGGAKPVGFRKIVQDGLAEISAGFAGRAMAERMGVLFAPSPVGAVWAQLDDHGDVAAPRSGDEPPPRLVCRECPCCALGTPR